MFNRKHTMTQHLPEWATKLLQALEIDSVQVNTQALEEIADTIKDDPATDHLLVGFIAGYAAGMAQGGGMASFEQAHAASVQFMGKHLSKE